MLKIKSDAQNAQRLDLYMQSGPNSYSYSVYTHLWHHACIT